MSSGKLALLVYRPDSRPALNSECLQEPMTPAEVNHVELGAGLQIRHLYEPSYVWSETLKSRIFPSSPKREGEDLVHMY